MNKKKLNILFRTSGGRATSKELGFGHIFRSLNLAKFLSDQRIFFLIEDYGGVKPLLKKYDSHTIFIKKNLDVKYVNKFFGLLAFEIWYRLFVTKEMTSDTTLN